MNAFVFVLNFKIKINVINAAKPEYCNHSNPRPLEQEPGREQDLNVLLHESFYACYNCWKKRRLCHILNRCMVFLLCVF